jgi:hypothetical protein
MRTLSRVFLTLFLFWNLCGLAQQPTPILPDPNLTPGDAFEWFFWRVEERVTGMQLYRRIGFPSESQGQRFIEKVPSSASANRDVRSVQIVTGRFGTFDLFRFRDQFCLKIPTDPLKVSMLDIDSSCFTALS